VDHQASSIFWQDELSNHLAVKSNTAIDQATEEPSVLPRHIASSSAQSIHNHRCRIGDVVTLASQGDRVAYGEDSWIWDAATAGDPELERSGEVIVGCSILGQFEAVGGS
jgi:hypothetical protein